MKLKSLLFFTLASATAGAAPTQYRISSQVYIDGKLASSPRIITLAHEKAEVRQSAENAEGPSDIRVSVTPSDFKNESIQDGILMKFEVEYKAGDRVVKSTPQIIARPGLEAEFSVGSLQGHEELKLKVTATRE